MTFSNIIHETEDYVSSTACAVNSFGDLFVAQVVNPPGGVDTQYCVIHKINLAKVNTEIKRLYARDAKAFLLAEGADPTLPNGKYGNVSIAIWGVDLYLCIEIRYNDVNKGRWAILKGSAV